MLEKIKTYSSSFNKKNSLILIFLLLIIGCSHQIKLEKNSSLVFEETYYHSWIAGVRGGGSGLNIYLTLKNSPNKNIQLEGIYFKQQYCTLEFQGDYKYLCHILTNENRENNLVKKTVKIENNTTNKIPFDIAGEDAVIVYFENQKKKYLKITMLYKEIEYLPL